MKLIIQITLGNPRRAFGISYLTFDSMGCIRRRKENVITTIKKYLYY